jgi:hypothetical protein
VRMKSIELGTVRPEYIKTQVKWTYTWKHQYLWLEKSFIVNKNFVLNFPG